MVRFYQKFEWPIVSITLPSKSNAVLFPEISTPSTSTRILRHKMFIRNSSAN